MFVFFAGKAGIIDEKGTSKVLTDLGICRNGIAPDSYVLTKADIIQLRKITRNGGGGRRERVRRCQSVLRRSFKRCLGHLLF